MANAVSTLPQFKNNSDNEWQELCKGEWNRRKYSLIDLVKVPAARRYWW